MDEGDAATVRSAVEEEPEKGGASTPKDQDKVMILCSFRLCSLISKKFSIILLYTCTARPHPSA